jgi:hypothetical protein
MLTCLVGKCRGCGLIQAACIWTDALGNPYPDRDEMSSSFANDPCLDVCVVDGPVFLGKCQCAERSRAYEATKAENEALKAENESLKEGPKVFAKNLTSPQRDLLKAYIAMCGFEPMHQEDFDSGEMTFEEMWRANVCWIGSVASQISLLPTSAAFDFDDAAPSNGIQGGEGL